MHMPTIDYNIASTVLKRAELDPGRRALVFEGKEKSYREFGDRIRRLATALRAGGVCCGDRVGFLGFNHPAFLETMFAAGAIGAIFVPLNFRLTGPELSFIINDAGVHTLIVDDAMRDIIDSIRGELCCQIYIGSESAAGNWTGFESLVDASEPVADVVNAEQHEVAVIMYTSGTTGRPKGAMLTHGNLLWNNMSAALTFAPTREDISITAAPLFHIGGLNVTTIGALQAGSTVIVHRNFDPTKAIEDFQKYRVTMMFGAPAMFLFISQHPQFADADLSSIRLLIVGGAPVPQPLLELYKARNVTLCQGYGLTETAPFAAFLVSEYMESKLGSAGLPPLFGATRIVSADNQPLPAGEVGEICYRGPNVMKGYWNRPEATAEAIDAEGWFHTGDAGHLDEGGFLFISDRVKDMVISGGENVYPAEVESVLYDHPAIGEVAVIGLPDEKWGEAVTAVVALNEGASLELEELRDFAGEKLARYKLPLRLLFVEALPRNPAGKVLKFELRDQFS